MRAESSSCLGQLGLSHVAAFARVVDAGSFTAAARQLGLSKATISKHVAHLEARLGASLLNRTTRSLGLTEEGARFYTHCNKILEELEAAESEILSSLGVGRGRIRISAPSLFGSLEIAPALHGFMARYPEIEIELSLRDDTGERADDGVDIAIRTGRSPIAGGRSVRLAPCIRIVCATPAYRARYGEPTTPGELAGHNCFRFGLGAHGRIWHMEGPGGSRNVTVSGRFRANSPAALRLAVLSDLGLALIPEAMVADDLAAGRLVTVLPAFRDRSEAWYLDYPAGRAASSMVQAFADFLQPIFQAPAAIGPGRPSAWLKDLEHDALA
jgi:DNA-binding transcriptional LysR family regulator